MTLSKALRWAGVTACAALCAFTGATLTGLVANKTAKTAVSAAVRPMREKYPATCTWQDIFHASAVRRH